MAIRLEGKIEMTAARSPKPAAFTRADGMAQQILSGAFS